LTSRSIAAAQFSQHIEQVADGVARSIGELKLDVTSEVFHKTAVIGTVIDDNLTSVSIKDYLFAVDPKYRAVLSIF
jgi:hypothetical protein